MGSTRVVAAVGHPAWPAGFSDLPDPPAQLYVIGSLPSPELPCVAVVGSRRPSVEALRFTRDLAAELAAAGVVVVSGGACGIDAAAHEGAVAAGGRTVAVLAGDVLRPGPAVNRALFRRICTEGGALVAEHADLPKHGGAFIARNRLIAAWASAVVVVEARLRSGTRSTALCARRLGRLLFAVPWSPYHAPGAGCLRLISEGAVLLSDATPVLSHVGRATAAAPGTVTLGARLTPSDRRLLGALARCEGASLESLVEMLALPLPVLLRELSRLELEGLVESGGSGRYRVCASGV